MYDGTDGLYSHDMFNHVHESFNARSDLLESQTAGK